MIGTTQEEAGEPSEVSGQCSSRWEGSGSDSLGRNGCREYQALDPNCDYIGGGSKIIAL